MEEDINYLENMTKEYKQFRDLDNPDYEDTERIYTAIQHLIARYKKSEDKNKTLETLLQGNLYQMYLYYKELAGRYQANSISKDKVREKIDIAESILNKYNFQRENDEDTDLSYEEAREYACKVEAWKELLED